MDLRDKVCLVTGATEGIGREIAFALAERGAKLGVCARSADKVDSVAQELRGKDTAVVGASCDVTSAKAVTSFVESVRAEFSGIDVLVNNAGIGYFAPIEDADLAQLDQMIAVNLRGVILATRAVVPTMKEAGGGFILNIASLAGKNPVPSAAVYAATKHAVLGLSKSLMLELRPSGIRVASICPGSVDTAFFEKANAGDGPPSNVLTPADVAKSVIDVLEMRDGSLVSEVDLRPAKPGS